MDPPLINQICPNANNKLVGSELSCTELKYPISKIMTNDAGHKVCGTDKINKLCSGMVTYKEAEQTCKSKGARLCTSEELLMGVGESNQPCTYDLGNVWSSTSCSIDKKTDNIKIGQIGVMAYYKNIEQKQEENQEQDISSNNNTLNNEYINKPSSTNCLLPDKLTTGYIFCCGDKFGKYCSNSF